MPGCIRCGWRSPAATRSPAIGEHLYGKVELDVRKSDQKQFDYVDPKNRAVQIEMERAATEHLKRIGAWLKPKFKTAQPGGRRASPAKPPSSSR